MTKAGFFMGILFASGIIAAARGWLGDYADPAVRESYATIHVWCGGTIALLGFIGCGILTAVERQTNLLVQQHLNHGRNRKWDSDQP